MARLNEIKHELSYLKSRVELMSTTGAGLTQVRATVQDADTVPAAPHAQVAPAGVDVMAALVTPTFSGVFLVTYTLGFTSTTVNDVVTVTARSIINNAGNMSIAANATPCGTNCFFATANGSITVAGATNTFLHATAIYDDIANPAGNNLRLNNPMSLIIRPTPAVNPSVTYTLNRAIVVVLRIAGAGTISGTPGVAGAALSGTMSVTEVRGFA